MVYEVDGSPEFTRPVSSKNQQRSRSLSFASGSTCYHSPALGESDLGFEAKGKSMKTIADTSRWLCSALAGLFILATIVSYAYADRCPMAENDAHDGQIDEAEYNFTYESWVRDAEHAGESYHQFGRCIENRGNDEVWTHWKGILADSWIPQHDRLLRVLKRTADSSEEKDKELWYGDGRDNMAVVQTTCWKNEKPCESPESDAEDSTAEDDPHASSNDDSSSEDNSARGRTDEEAIQHAIELGRDFTAFDYGEIFVPTDEEDILASLVRVGVEIISIVSWEYPDILRYNAAIYLRHEDTEKLEAFLENGRHNVLVSLSFSNPILQESLSTELIVDRNMVQYLLDRLQPEMWEPFIVFGKELRGNVKNIVFSSTSIEIKNFYEQVFAKIPVAVYAFDPW